MGQVLPNPFRTYSVGLAPFAFVGPIAGPIAGPIVPDSPSSPSSPDLPSVNPRAV